MSREVTSAELCRIIIILLLGIVIVQNCTGCATPYVPVKQYEVKAFTIVMGTHEYINQMRQALDPQAGVEVDGFIHYPTRTVYVPYSIKKDDYGNDKPDFEMLGHEVWHLQELGHRWHK